MQGWHGLELNLHNMPKKFHALMRQKLKISNSPYEVIISYTY